ncbi:MAG TPA: SDR family oxidoreductase [Acidimicrobiia bacterium]|nr:SDR family oxidoreductase [Acidimicrobiia bacterium]HEV3450325.1 SDR family oxidoreductase [Acidimicrobiia bacterium]
MIDLRLADRAALVTGAGAGIGRAVASWLARAGCDVALVDRDAAALASAAAEAGREGTRVAAVEADLRRDGAAADAVEATVAALGGLDVAVNNVGSLAGLAPAPFLDQDPGYVAEVVTQNLLVTAACCRAEGAAMVAARVGGVILNVSSGESTRPALDLAAYGAAKAAINHLSQTLAVELGPHGVRVNAVAPGTTLTPSTRDALSDDYLAALVTSIPLGRMNEPDDLARLVVALASDLGRGVTGQLVLSDNGAHLARNRPRLETT